VQPPLWGSSFHPDLIHRIEVSGAHLRSLASQRRTGNECWLASEAFVT
jgi:hypothetical protein